MSGGRLQDPLHPSETVIVVRSLVPGGVAQQDGRIVPGDRLLFINAVDLSNASLAEAVAALKAAPLGLVHLGIAKPIPYDAVRLFADLAPAARQRFLLDVCPTTTMPLSYEEVAPPPVRR